MGTHDFMELAAAVVGFAKTIDRRLQGAVFNRTIAEIRLILLKKAEPIMWRTAFPWWIKDRTSWWPKRWRRPQSPLSELDPVARVPREADTGQPPLCLPRRCASSDSRT